MLLQGLSAEFLKELIAFNLENDPAERRWHVTRMYMYKALENALASVDGPQLNGLAVSGSAPLVDVLGLKRASTTEVSYPEVDLIRLPFGSATFDFCVSDQVLEHIADPFGGIRETFRVVKPGGYVVVTTCFLNEEHHCPVDYWRFTPAALRLLCEREGAQVLDIGGWGNREVWSFMEAGFRFSKIPENPDNPIFRMAMRNEPGHSIVTWVIARAHVNSDAGRWSGGRD